MGEGRGEGAAFVALRTLAIAGSDEEGAPFTRHRSRVSTATEENARDRRVAARTSGESPQD